MFESGRKVTLQGLKRTFAVAHDVHRKAGALVHIFPGITLKIDGRSSGQVVPAPAAQSLEPALETPKHFSFSAATAPVALTRTVVETAAATALASMAALKTRRVFIDGTFPCVYRRHRPPFLGFPHAARQGK